MSRLGLLLPLLWAQPSCTGSTPADASTSPGLHPAQKRAQSRQTDAEADRGRAPTPELGGSTVTLHAVEGDVVVKVEVVKTQDMRGRGLMYRERMAQDAGMLFLFREPEHQTFWMRNTYIPLDMIFIGADQRVVGVAQNAAPRTDTTRQVDGDSQYVLEVNAGFARRWGVGPGTLVEFGGVDETGVDP